MNANPHLALKTGRLHRLSCIVPLFLAFTCIEAQGPQIAPPTSVRSDTDAKITSYSAFKAGDVIRGLASVEGLIRHGPGQPSEDLQRAKHVAAIGFGLRDEKAHGRASDAGALALTMLARSGAAMTKADTIAAQILTAEIHQHINGDPVRAKAAYEQVLRLDPTIAWVAARLQRLQAIEDAAKQKARANLLLEQRNRSAKK